MTEKEIRALGFEPWYGGDEAPGDWDGTNDVLLRNGDTEYNEVEDWLHLGDLYDIIGYKKKETPMEYPEWVYVRARHLRIEFTELCQHILDYEQPPVDPDLELARKVYLEWLDGCHGVEDALLAAIKEARNA